ncbi:sarcosine oxidase subunit gamma [Gordonia sputi]|uniref:sarcosine oxidase subunit gamma n=1 Tax=Gordonia sputi TaxID=36823 RepID=UPI0020433055|nr:sarcosine oxidase subunit gamma family protein [Gordonia sputi]MCM3897896.1 sarcosine oxidase subunit gamma [Gordonia sputi]
MADTPTTSPLGGHYERFAALSDTARPCEEPYVTMVDLRVDPTDPDAHTAAQIVGLAALPTTPSTRATTGQPGSEVTAIWRGPDEWLVTTTAMSGTDLETRLRAAMTGGAAVDVSAQHTTVRLSGRHARDVLAKGCAVDLHPRVVGTGAAIATMLGQAAVVIVPLDDVGTDYRIIVRSSFARYLGDWIVDAAAEFALPEPGVGAFR